MLPHVGYPQCALPGCADDLSRHAAAESFADEQRAEESAMLLAELPSSADGTDSSSGDDGEALFYGRDRQCGCSDPFSPRLLNWFG